MSDIKLKNVLLIFTTASSIIGFIMLLLYFVIFNGDLSKDSMEWANFGNYFASITGLMAFSAVLFTAYLSEIQAKDARNETYNVMKASRRRDELDLYFKLLELHNNNIHNLYFINPNNDIITYKDANAKYVFILNCIIFDYLIFQDIKRRSASELADLSLQWNNPYYLTLNKYRDLVYNFSPDNSDKILLTPSNNVAVFDLVKKNIDNYLLFYKKNFKDIIGYHEHNKINGTHIPIKFSLEYDIELIYSSMQFASNFLIVNYGHILGPTLNGVQYILSNCNKMEFEQESKIELFKSQLTRNELILCLAFALSKKSNKDFVIKLKSLNFFEEICYEDLAIFANDKKYENYELNFVNQILDLYINS